MSTILRLILKLRFSLSYG